MGTVGKCVEARRGPGDRRQAPGEAAAGPGSDSADVWPASCGMPTLTAQRRVLAVFSKTFIHSHSVFAFGFYIIMLSKIMNTVCVIFNNGEL